MKNFVADGDSIVAIAPYAVTPGLGMLIGSLFCVSTKTAAAGGSTDAVTEGQFDLLAVSAETATPGAVAYWDDVNRRVSVSGGTPIGTLPYGKSAGVATARVRLQSVAGAVSGARIPIALLKPMGSFESTAEPSVLNYTLSTTVVSPVPFYAVRLRFYNVTTIALASNTAGIAPSANMTGGIHAATGTPVQVTVAAATSWTEPAAISGGGTSGAVPSETVSDWITCASLPRDDGGAGYLLVVRHFTPTLAHTFVNRVGSLGQTAAEVNAYGCGAVAGNNVDGTFTNWGSLTINVNNLGSCFSLEVMTAAGARVVAQFGDSTFAGTDSYRSNAGGLTLAAMAVLSNSTPLSWWNDGEASQTSNVYSARALTFLAADPVLDYFAYSPWSPNDTDKYTQAGVDRMTRQTLFVLQECRRLRITPVLATPCPVGGISAANEAFRRQMVVATKSLAASFGAKVVDRDALYTDYSTTSGGWLAGMNFNTVHPTPASYLLESALWRTALGY